jgi:hypothetical protein
MERMATRPSPVPSEYRGMTDDYLPHHLHDGTYLNLETPPTKAIHLFVCASLWKYG